MSHVQLFVAGDILLVTNIQICARMNLEVNPFWSSHMISWQETDDKIVGEDHYSDLYPVESLCHVAAETKKQEADDKPVVSHRHCKVCARITASWWLLFYLYPVAPLSHVCSWN